VTITWGDGSTSAGTVSVNPAGGWVVSGTHAYGDNGTYAVGVTITDRAGGGAASVGSTASVSNVAPTVALSGPAAGVRGQALSFAGTFTDPGWLDAHEVSWDFGDGTVLAYRPADGEALAPSHAYAATGAFTVTLRVRDDDGGVGVFSYRVNVGPSACRSTRATRAARCSSSRHRRRRQDPLRAPGQPRRRDGADRRRDVRRLPPTSRVVAYGLGGNDDIGAAGTLGVPAFSTGGEATTGSTPATAAASSSAATATTCSSAATPATC
jgi:PKD repeat protein